MLSVSTICEDKGAERETQNSRAMDVTAGKIMSLSARLEHPSFKFALRVRTHSSSSRPAIALTARPFCLGFNFPAAHHPPLIFSLSAALRGRHRRRVICTRPAKAILPVLGVAAAQRTSASAGLSSWSIELAST